jgi:hypothetical protein
MSVAPTFTPAHLFAEIGARDFSDYQTFETTLAEHFRAHVLDLPAGYRMRDAIDWGLSRHVVRREGTIIRIIPSGT